MKLYLIRHGMTEPNERHLYCGSSDAPLSDAGKQALRALHYARPDAQFCTSGMKRTDETLTLLFGDVPYRVEPRFREVDFGIFEMHSYEELKNTPDYQAWLTGDNERNVPPNGESGEQMARRVLEAFHELQEDTVLVTHGGVIATIMAHRFPDAGKNRYEWQPKNGHGYCITDDGYYAIP